MITNLKEAGYDKDEVKEMIRKWGIRGTVSAVIVGVQIKNESVNEDSKRLIIRDINNLYYEMFYKDPDPRLLDVKISYTPVKIPKTTGGYRTLHIPNPELKEVQKSLIPFLLSLGQFHNSCIGFMPGKSVYHHAYIHKDAKMILKMDIKDFFDSVTDKMFLDGIINYYHSYGMVQKMIKYFIQLYGGNKKYEVISRDMDVMLKRLAEVLFLPGGKGVPQGSPSSPIVANICFFSIDKALYRLAKNFGAKYSRYADDMIFSFPHKDMNVLLRLKMVAQRIIYERSLHNLVVNAKKTRIMYPETKAIVCGVKIMPDGSFSLPRSYKKRFRAIVHNWKNKKISDSVMNGHIGYVKMVLKDKADEFLKKNGLTIDG